MSEEIQWDSSLVKKFGSSNHFKLLTQLKTEVKTFPLKRKNSNTSSLNQKNINNNNQSVRSNSLDSNISSSVEDRINQTKNHQTQSLFKSKHNSFNNINSTFLEVKKVNMSNESIINHALDSEIEEKQKIIYNNNSKNNNLIENAEFINHSSKVTFKET